MATNTLVLLGDSILDNAPYTAGEPDTTAHLQRVLAPDWSVRRLAQDGAIMDDIRYQLADLDGTPAVAVLSVGGNDVTSHIGLLERAATSAAEVLEDLLTITETFGERYESVARAVAARAERTVLCTIYEVPLEPAFLARLARVPLALLNDRITRVGSRIGADVLDLRTVCTDPGDFVLQIEPSAAGAGKIARAIAAVIEGLDGLPSGRLFSGLP